MDATSMSLDEIIKKKMSATGFRRNGKARPANTMNKPKRFPDVYSKQRTAGKMIDARNKIIQNNRSKIRDARDKLTQITKKSGDARLRLIKKLHQNRTPPVNVLKKRRPYITDRPIYIQNDLMDIDHTFAPASIALRRTVKNDIAFSKMPPLPNFDRLETHRRASPNIWNSDPFDCYEVPVGRPADVSEPKHLHRQIRNINIDGIPRKGILRAPRDHSPPPSNSGYIPDENSHLSYEMRTRLERVPDSNASMGIFSNPYTKITQPPINGYRIVVSNLHHSVSQSDIKELFEDIGHLLEARLVRPGVAEVIFDSMKDAETAVDTYHNRQLDGQPMKCLLVNPRASSKPTAPALTSRSTHSSKPSKTSLEIDIDALHKVLFRRK